MTSFDTHGFMSSDISDFEVEIESNFPEKFLLATEINQSTHELIFTIEIDDQDLPDLLIATLLGRQASSYQAFLILLKKGLLSQAEIMLRNIAENMFIVAAIGKDPKFADNYVQSEEISRKKALVRLNKYNEKNGKKVDPSIHDLIAELDDKIATDKIQKYTIERIAQIAELTDYYDTLYPHMSMAVHTSTRSLDKSLQINEEGEIQSIEYGPIKDGLDMHLDYGMSMMLHTMYEVAVKFEKETGAIEKLQKQNKLLAGGTQ